MRLKPVQNRTVPTWSLALALAVGLALAASLLVWPGSPAATQSQAEITLSLDGDSTSLTTTATTVAEVLAARDIVVSERDVVAPSLNTAVSTGTVIAVRFARPLDIVVDGSLTRYWVTATDLSSALAEKGLKFGGSVLSASRQATLSRSGIRLSVVTPKRVTLAIAGRKPVKRKIAAATVKQALATRGVSYDRNDIVKPKVSKKLKNGMRISLTRVRFAERTQRAQKVPFTTVYRNDDNLEEGTTRVEVAGVEGSRDATYRKKIVNGAVVSTTLVKLTNQVAPVNAVVRKGTKKAVVVTAPVLTPSTGYGVWDKLAQCESGGNWSINTGNGYYGGLQFNLATWRGYGGPGYPHQQSRETQIGIATKLRDARGGYGSWPACARKLGLPS